MATALWTFGGLIYLAVTIMLVTWAILTWHDSKHP